jgi:formate C-acetyltransferase
MEVPQISIERAKYFTEKWDELEGSGMSNSMLVALSMKNVYEKMTHHFEPDDRIAGYWTESFLGIPVDIERGVFNNVLETELRKKSVVWFKLKSILNTGGFLLKKRQLGNFIKNVKILREMGSLPINFSNDTMKEREINPYTIDPADEKELLDRLLPRWKGKSIMDILEREIKSSGLLDEATVDFALALPANTSKQTFMISPCATIARYQGHVILDFKHVLDVGLVGIKKQVESLKKETEDKSELDFLESINVALDGVTIFANRLLERVEREYKNETDLERKEILSKIIENCKRVPIQPPDTFYQAVQSVWTLKTAIELAHPVNLHSLGRMDQLLYPYYKKDLAAGVITRDAARELLEELLLKLMSQNIRPESNTLANFYHRYLGSTPVTLGGLKPDGTDGTNELTFLFIEAARDSRAVTNVSIRVNGSTPDEVLSSVASALYEGSSNLSLFNDTVNIEAMLRHGFSLEDARDYSVMGCVEIMCPGKTGGMSANALLLCRLLDMTMRNGNAQTLIGLIKGAGLTTGDPDRFSSFQEFLDALLQQGKEQIRLIVEISNFRDKIFALHYPAPYISAFIDGCIRNKKDVTLGSACYDLTAISCINSIANLTDSLFVIKKLVFEEKLIDFSGFIKAIDANYKGYDELHSRIVGLKGKWGNGFKEVDDLAREVSTSLFTETYKFKNFRGGAIHPVMISMTTHTIDGRVGIATPDGRFAGTPYAASGNPYNVEENGVTGVLRSIASLDFSHVLGAAINVKFHPSALGMTDATRNKWIQLVRTYFSLGGPQLQPTVVSGELLHDAQLHPENYYGLIVKVGGYSAYFTELGVEIQNEVIARTEHGASI